MNNFFEEQGRTRIQVEAYMKYVADLNPRRTQLLGKRAIYRWKLEATSKMQITFKNKARIGEKAEHTR